MKQRFDLKFESTLPGQVENRLCWVKPDSPISANQVIGWYPRDTVGSANLLIVLRRSEIQPVPSERRTNSATAVVNFTGGDIFRLLQQSRADLKRMAYRLPRHQKPQRKLRASGFIVFDGDRIQLAALIHKRRERSFLRECFFDFIHGSASSPSATMGKAKEEGRGTHRCWRYLASTHCKAGDTI
jgi:hypothetical protein